MTSKASKRNVAESLHRVYDQTCNPLVAQSLLLTLHTVSVELEINVLKHCLSRFL